MNKKNTLLILSIAILILITIIFYMLNFGKGSIASFNREIYKIQTQSNSTEIEDIEKDINSTDLSDIDKELVDIERELYSND